MIFNLLAIIPFIIIVLLYLGFSKLLPGVESGIYGSLVLGVMTTVVGGLCEFLGIRGRLFFLPIWFFGLILVSLELYSLWGFLGLVLAAIIIVCSIIYLYKKTKQLEKAAWQTARSQLKELSDFESLSADLSFWEKVKAASFFTIWMDYTKDVCEHNLALISIVNYVASEGFTEEEKSLWGLFEEFLEENKEKESPDSIDSNLQRAIEDYLDVKCSSEAV